MQSRKIFTSPLGTLTCTQLRRFSVFRLRAADGASARVVLPAAGSPWRRCYGPYGTAPPPPPGYAAMPPPGMVHAYGPPPPGYAPAGYAPAGYAMPPPPPMQPPQMGFAAKPEIGTKERPLIIAEANTGRRSLISRLWMIVFFMIGISAFLHLMDEYDLRTGGGDMGAGAAKPGGIGGAARGPLSNMFGGSEPKPVDLDAQHTTFSDIRGCDEAKEELQEIVMFLKDPKKFNELGGRLPKGALLVGPPGTGKTMLAKAIAKEAGVKFFYATGSEFDEMFVGVGSRRVRELFAAAKANAPALIFIDEIDALGGKRTSKDHAYSRMTLNQILAEMDGFESSDEVIVIGATNTPDSLDKALTRPGRFDTIVAVDPPDLKGRTEIAEIYLAKIKKDETVKAEDIARGTAGFTGAELSNLINVAAIRAAVLDKQFVTAEEIEYAKDRVMMGAENRSKIIPEEEKRITAYHEGGHALVAMLLEKDGADPVHKATIVPRGSGIMGLVQQQPTHDKYSQSKKQMLARLQVCLAGRVAEEIILGTEDVTTGASSDFQQATNMARNMVRRFGFNDGLGTIDYESADTSEGAFISDSTKQKIEAEVRGIVSDAYAKAKALLTENRAKLDIVAEQLLAHETLSGEELKKAIAGQPITRKERPVKVYHRPPPPPPPSGNLPQLAAPANAAKAEAAEAAAEAIPVTAGAGGAGKASGAPTGAPTAARGVAK